MGESDEHLLKCIKHYQDSLERNSEKRNETKLLHSIEKLDKLHIKVTHLEATGIGRTVNGLRKFGGNVGNAAKALVSKWKEMVVVEEDTSKAEDSQQNSGDDSDDNSSMDENSSSHKDSDQSRSKKTRKPEDRHGDRHRGKKRNYGSDYESGDSESDSSEDENPRRRHKKAKSSRRDSSESEEERSHKRQKLESESDNEEKKSDHKKMKPSKSDDSKPRHKSKTVSDSEEESKKHSLKSKHKSETKSRTRSNSEDRSAKHDKTSSKSHHHHKSSEADSKSRHSSKSASKSSDDSRTKHKEHKDDKKKESKESRSDRHKESKSSDKHSKSGDKHSKSSDKHKSEDSKKSDKKSNESSKKSSSDDKKHKRSKESEKKEPTRQLSPDKVVNGIDSGSGASFAEALGMCMMPVPGSSKKRQLPTKSSEEPKTKSTSSSSNGTSYKSESRHTEKKEEKKSEVNGVPMPKQPLPEPSDIANLLPSITPNYRPLGNVGFDQPVRRAVTDDEALSRVISTKNQRTKVYSGNKVAFGKVPSLFELCVRVLQDNIDALEYTGGVPYSILKPILEKANPDQLYMMEHHNPYLIEETDELWQLHCQKEFKTKQREEMETWREMYMRCLDEREAKLKALTANIKQSQDKSLPVRTTKLAYVDSAVKPPRNIIKKQMKNGTAFDKKPALTPTSRLSQLATAGEAGKVAVPSPGVRAAEGSSRSGSSSFKPPKKAPLMAKTLSFMKNRFKR